MATAARLLSPVAVLRQLFQRLFPEALCTPTAYSPDWTPCYQSQIAYIMSDRTGAYRS